MGLIDKVDIGDLERRELLVIEWLGDNVFHRDFDLKAREYANLTVKIFNYYNNNRL